jgi:hypothetical protein
VYARQIMRHRDAVAGDEAIWGRIGVCLIAIALLVETVMTLLEYFA